jgi:metal-responsive CopG/Arc/MetJ family transcriptional regulator
MVGMKISVSLPDADIAYLDHIAAQRDRSNRSAILHEAIAALRERELTNDYEQAAREWVTSGEAAAWDNVASDGVE